MKKDPVWIAGIARGHNAGVCLLKDGEIVFSIEEERLTREKYDGGPLASMLKIKELPKNLDSTDGLAAAVCHFFNFDNKNPKKKYSNWSSFINKNPDKLI